MFGAVGKVLNKVEDIRVIAVKKDERLEATEFEGQKIVLLHFSTVRFVVSPCAEGSRVSKGKGSKIFIDRLRMAELETLLRIFPLVMWRKLLPAM